jgi:hypothetical protein
MVLYCDENQVRGSGRVHILHSGTVKIRKAYGSYGQFRYALSCAALFHHPVSK